ncbi:DUF1440 domain-containing protein [Allonocardiopsis opalescens]|uniref:DUF1440 domain-containing protein n=1 Tax=Allonocardiopsis opalescens TaxID=1144618 RepID=A0A2T0QAK3_9ACTN|nr:DUF1440 domain-containing protein [Allonocardiopsis opalescens]PRY00873.1 hypothetical protein CLV72_102505 [Allonocardiopsis opalescens]
MGTSVDGAPPAAAVRAAARGVVAAMAMSGVRRLWTGLGLQERTPPEDVLTETAPQVFLRVPRERRPAVVELAHWAYGGTAGAAFGLLPARVRRAAWSGPAYGIAVWALFEGVLAPALGLRHAKPGRPAERAAFLADHVLYGLIVAAHPAGRRP